MAKRTGSNLNQAHLMSLTLSDIHNLGCEVLKKKRTPSEIASRVVDELIINELNGYTSHGLLRLIEYAQLIQGGHINPSTQPVVHKKSDFVSEIDGQKCFGVLSTETVSQALTNHLINNQFGFVTLINSGHIGRLRSIAAPVCQQGGVIIGFSNLSGTGQNVLAYGGNEGRLCTNPIVIGVPSEPPIILDMSTSTVSEGKVRELWLKGEEVPKGWLFDKNWESVCDPEKFYQKPQAAFLGPLGGKELGYKGFALALMTEIFAGILTNGGFSQSTSSNVNNNGLFFAFHPTFLGQTLKQFQKKVRDLIKYLKSSSINDELHVPDWNIDFKIKNIDKKQSISINNKLFEEIKLLASS